MVISIVTTKILKYVALTILTLSVVCVAQATQFYMSNADLRMHAVDKWVAVDESRSEIATEFVTACIKGRVELKPISVYRCGESIGANELVLEIRKADDVLKTLAWPLRVFG